MTAFCGNFDAHLISNKSNAVVVVVGFGLEVLLFSHAKGKLKKKHIFKSEFYLYIFLCYKVWKYEKNMYKRGMFWMKMGIS